MDQTQYASCAEIGLDARRLQAAYDLLDGWTQGPQAPIPGAAMLVGRRGRTVAPRYFGRQGPDSQDEPIRQDGAFLLASITKPVTYLGAMLLVERGLLSLADRVTKYIPEFAAHHKEETLLLHLFTHTSGMPDMLANNIELRRAHAPLSEFTAGAIRDTLPLFAPGTNLSYQSMGTLIVAEIVQRISGLPIADFLEREIFRPLGLQSTALGARHIPRERLVRVQLPADTVGTDYHWNSPYWRDLGSPWGGLFSTPQDLGVICQLMLDGGRKGDVQLISRATVERMTSNRLLEQPGLPEPIARTQPWGLGWRLNHPGTADSWGELLGPATFGHVGATGTMAWIDPRALAFCILFTSAPLAQNQWRLVRLSNAVAASFL